MLPPPMLPREPDELLPELKLRELLPLLLLRPDDEEPELYPLRVPDEPDDEVEVRVGVDVRVEVDVRVGVVVVRVGVPPYSVRTPP